MLTATQVEVVAYYIADSGGFTCRDCTAQITSRLTVEKADEGMTPGRVEPIIRYTLEEHASESLWEYLSQELEGDELDRAFDEAELQEHCDVCGTELL